MGMGLDRPLADVQQLGCLGDRQLEDKPTRQHFTLSSCQRPHDGDERSDFVAVDDRVLGPGDAPDEHQRSSGSLGGLAPHPGPTAVETAERRYASAAPRSRSARGSGGGRQGLLDGVLRCLSAADHHNAQSEEGGVVPSEQHVDQLAARQVHRRIVRARGTPLTHGEDFLRNGLRHAQESFDRPLRLTHVHRNCGRRRDDAYRSDCGSG